MLLSIHQRKSAKKFVSCIAGTTKKISWLTTNLILQKEDRKAVAIAAAFFYASSEKNRMLACGFGSYRTKCVDENRFQALKIKG